MKTLHIETGFLGTEGSRLYYEVAGEGFPLLLIHAGVADSRMWDEQFSVFAQHYRVIRYDVRGFGQSEVSAGPNSNHGDVADLFRHLHIEKAHIIGILIWWSGRARFYARLPRDGSGLDFGGSQH